MKKHNHQVVLNRKLAGQVENFYKQFQEKGYVEKEDLSKDLKDKLYSEIYNKNLGAAKHYISFINNAGIEYITTANQLDVFVECLSNSLKRGTASVYFRTIATVYTKFQKRKLIKENPFIHYDNKPKKSPLKFSFLTPKELKYLEKFEPKLDSAKKAKEILLFACYTGLRYYDICRVDKDMIFETDGITYLVITPKKTSEFNKIVKLPISILFDGKPLALLKKYNYDLPMRRKYISDMFRLRNLEKELKLPKKIHFHMGRHTFGTTLAQKTGDIFAIIELMGINFETAKYYIHTSALDINAKLKNTTWS